MKFKGKVDISETNELVKLKDEEICSLQNEKEHLLKIEREFMNIQQQVEGLRGELELVEEEKFNVESLSNERALGLEEAKQENQKLVEEITIIGERHGELERVLQDITSNEPGEPGDRQTGVLKAENMVLKQQANEYEGLKAKLREFEAQACSKKEQNSCAQPLPSGLASSYQSLLRLLEDRTKGKQQEKMISVIDKLLSRQLKGGSLE